MRYMLDTNICIYALKNKPENIIRHLSSLRPTDIGISSITVAELRLGASNSQHPRKNHQILDAFLWPFGLESFSHQAALEYGKIAAFLKKKGAPIGSFDCLIAAHAVVLGLTVVTNNVKGFKRIPKLKIENWVSS